MAQLRFDVNGKLIQFFESEKTLALYGSNPVPGVVSSINIDEDVNAALIDDVGIDNSKYKSIAGILQKDGININIVAPGQDYLDAQQISTLKSILSPTAGAITLAQAKVMFRVIFKALNKLGVL